MSQKQIVFPTDFSLASDAALDYATRLAKSFGAKLLIVHVQEPPVLYGEGDFYYGVENPDPQTLAKMLSKLAATDADVAYQHRLLCGDPAHEIVALAKRENAELIVMSSHGRTGISRALLGSVADVVVRHATCPVLVLKRPHGKKPSESPRRHEDVPAAFLSRRQNVGVAPCSP
jgi:nucleotide-binding universal stress UspA family protein